MLNKMRWDYELWRVLSVIASLNSAAFVLALARAELTRDRIGRMCCFPQLPKQKQKVRSLY